MNDDEEEAWMPVLAEFEEFTLFCEELTVYAEAIRKLPYGLLALIVVWLKDIKTGEEMELDPADWETYEKIFYFLAGAMLTTTDKNLKFTDEDLDKLEMIISHMVTRISLIEGYLAGVLEAKYVEDEEHDEIGWRYGMNDDQFSYFINKVRELEKKDE